MEIHHRLRATDVSPYAQATALASRMGIYERRVSLLLFVHARCGAIHRGYRLGIRFLLGRHLASVFVSGWSLMFAVCTSLITSMGISSSLKCSSGTTKMFIATEWITLPPNPFYCIYEITYQL
jgi:hypothetical protein